MKIIRILISYSCIFCFCFMMMSCGPDKDDKSNFTKAGYWKTENGHDLQVRMDPMRRKLLLSR